MSGLIDIEITKAIAGTFYKKLEANIESDVIIVGAGPAGLTAAFYLANKGIQTTIIERKLSPGGGVWGGGMCMNEAVIQNEALSILDDIGIRHQAWNDQLHTVDTVEMASGLIFKAIQAGATMFNTVTVEDVAIKDGRIEGAVINSSPASGVLHVDPITLQSKMMIDGTGHDAAVVACLRKRSLLDPDIAKNVEGPMNAEEGEIFVAKNVIEVYPGLWLAGMSVCAVLGGPRMGPIFGGMLLSGKNAAEKIMAQLGK